MRRLHPSRTRSLSSAASFAALLCLSGCAGDDSKTSAGSTSSASATTDGETSTSGSTSTSSSSSDSSTSASSSSSTSDASSSTSDASSSSGGTGGLPDGGACVSDGECMSGHCYVITFLGGTCGECFIDSDCAGGGCSPPNPFDGTPPMCNKGEAGGGCETSEVCMPGLECATVVDLLGLIQISTCGECVTDAACDPGDLCAPDVDLANFKGQNTCIPPGTMPQDAYCDLAGSGDEACMSGICSTVDVMGIAQIGACGECDTDADCQGGTCMLGTFDLDTATLVGSTCV
ncbi:MAG: hypothetical protein H6711_34425 [Myxococcales bacterium]|nr:hypothetical protein [Myxococcales bacterium]